MNSLLLSYLLSSKLYGLPVLTETCRPCMSMGAPKVTRSAKVFLLKCSWNDSVERQSRYSLWLKAM
jgi:hypothetical protein